MIEIWQVTFVLGSMLAVTLLSLYLVIITMKKFLEQNRILIELTLSKESERRQRLEMIAKRMSTKAQREQGTGFVPKEGLPPGMEDPLGVA